MFEEETSTPAETSPIEGQGVETAEEQEQVEEVNEETPEESLEDEGQGELIAGKFKSQDDLVKAYKNLEREFHKSRQPQQELQPQQQMQQQYEDPNMQFWEIFQNDPLGTLQFFINNTVQEKTQPIYESQAEQQLKSNIQQLSTQYNQVNTEEGLSSLFGKLEDIANELGNPSILQNPTPRILRMAAQEAFGDNTAQLYQQAKQKGREEAESTRRAKQGLTTSNNTKPKQTEKTPEEQLADMIVNAGYGGGLFR